MRAVYKVIAETENMIQKEGWKQIVTWGPLQYDSLEANGTLYSTKEGAEDFARYQNNRLIELLAARINDLTGVKQGKGAVEYSMCVQALKERPYRVELIQLSQR
jgi:hypothetical protein